MKYRLRKWVKYTLLITSLGISSDIFRIVGFTTTGKLLEVSGILVLLIIMLIAYSDLSPLKSLFRSANE